MKTGVQCMASRPNRRCDCTTGRLIKNRVGFWERPDHLEIGPGGLPDFPPDQIYHFLAGNWPWRLVGCKESKPSSPHTWFLVRRPCMESRKIVCPDCAEESDGGFS